VTAEAGLVCAAASVQSREHAAASDKILMIEL